MPINIQLYKEVNQIITNKSFPDGLSKESQNKLTKIKEKFGSDEFYQVFISASGDSFRRQQYESEEAFNKLLELINSACKNYTDCAKRSAEYAVDMLWSWLENKGTNFKDYYNIKKWRNPMSSVVKTTLSNLLERTLSDFRLFMDNARNCNDVVIDFNLLNDSITQITEMKEKIETIDIPDTDTAASLVREIKSYLDEIRICSTAMTSQQDAQTALKRMIRKIEELESKSAKFALKGKSVSTVRDISEYKDPEMFDPDKRDSGELDELGVAVYVLEVLKKNEFFLSATYDEIMATFVANNGAINDPRIQRFRAEGQKAYNLAQQQTNPTLKSKYLEQANRALKMAKSLEQNLVRQDSITLFIQVHTEILNQIVSSLRNLARITNFSAYGTFKERYNFIRRYGLDRINHYYESARTAIAASNVEELNNIRDRLNAIISLVTEPVDGLAPVYENGGQISELTPEEEDELAREFGGQIVQEGGEIQTPIPESGELIPDSPEVKKVNLDPVAQTEDEQIKQWKKKLEDDKPED